MINQGGLKSQDGVWLLWRQSCISRILTTGKRKQLQISNYCRFVSSSRRTISIPTSIPFLCPLSNTFHLVHLFTSCSLASLSRKDQSCEFLHSIINAHIDVACGFISSLASLSLDQTSKCIMLVLNVSPNSYIFHETMNHWSPKEGSISLESAVCKISFPF